MQISGTHWSTINPMGSHFRFHLHQRPIPILNLISSLNFTNSNNFCTHPAIFTSIFKSIIIYERNLNKWNVSFRMIPPSGFLNNNAKYPLRICKLLTVSTYLNTFFDPSSRTDFDSSLYRDEYVKIWVINEIFYINNLCISVNPWTVSCHYEIFERVVAGST